MAPEYVSPAVEGHKNAIRLLLASKVGAREIACLLDLSVGRVRALMYANGLQGSEHSRKFSRYGDSDSAFSEPHAGSR